jgi:hypothetical protein
MKSLFQTIEILHVYCKSGLEDEVLWATKCEGASMESWIIQQYAVTFRKLRSEAVLLNSPMDALQANETTKR